MSNRIAVCSAASPKAPLPTRPQPHETGGRQPQPEPARPHPQRRLRSLPRLSAGLAEEIERQEREDDARGYEPEDLFTVWRAQAAGAPGRYSRPADAELRERLQALAAEHHPLVVRVAARALRIEDVALAQDIAQDVWLTAWQYLLGGHRIEAPRGYLATLARRRVRAHYAQARTRYEEAVDYADTTRAAVRLAERIGAAA
ncbi:MULTISPECIES: sigma factor [unclassified Streptomyces]|uniref:RNA polymerase sigma factor n=1 Tax=unclassified Streptomyces TaxID=2593676 RepID=UPI00081F4B8C|nr:MULTISPECIES: sigma factor [unclassified Streptomyces]MYR27805.1 sigma-70 family RNA polymerase sigma factor [Streptomyces sp. SID4945]SCF29580.1 Sigma-70 region 2 [Streptomyces sp. LcepLS]